MRHFLLLILLVGSALAASRPNVVVFLTDDQGYGDLGCMGSTTIKTPAVDSLARDGMTFKSFYVHNRCSPTRLAFMTGSQALRAGYDKVIYRKSRIGIHDQEITVAELLQEAGYATGIVGKWHLGEYDQFNPGRQGFDFFYGFMHYDDKGVGIFRNAELVEKIKSKTDGIHSEKLLRAGVEFIEGNKDRPFFLYYASPLPHVKWRPDPRFAGKSAHGTYGDVVEEIDWQVGELLRTLDRLNLSRKTLFVFASDNGPQLNVQGHGSAGPLRDGKWTNFEGGIRVPCLMRWPGVIPPGSTNDEITCIMDLLPTFCALAGVQPPTDRVIDGRNIVPYLKGERVPPIHASFIVPGRTIRHGSWKLLLKEETPGGKSRVPDNRQSAPAGSLFNLARDVGETENLASRHPEVVAELEARMAAFEAELARNSREIGTIRRDAALEGGK